MTRTTTASHIETLKQVSQELMETLMDLSNFDTFAELGRRSPEYRTLIHALALSRYAIDAAHQAGAAHSEERKNKGEA